MTVKLKMYTHMKEGLSFFLSQVTELVSTKDELDGCKRTHISNSSGHILDF